MKKIYSDKANKIPKGFGVYVHYDVNNKITYVGKSSNVRTRLRQHMEHDLIKDQKFCFPFHYAKWIMFDTSIMQEDFENFMIKKHKPKNNMYITNPDRIPPMFIEDIPMPQCSLIYSDEIMVEIESPWDYSELNEDKSVPDQGYFVYCLYNEFDRPLYVGQSNSLFSRLIDNIRRPAKNNHDFHYARWTGFVDERDRNEYKKYLIQTMETRYNRKPKKTPIISERIKYIELKNTSYRSDLIKSALFI